MSNNSSNTNGSLANYEVLMTNYLFVKRLPMYVDLEQKYKVLKKKNKELEQKNELLMQLLLESRCSEGKKVRPSLHIKANSALNDKKCKQEVVDLVSESDSEDNEEDVAEECKVRHAYTSTNSLHNIVEEEEEETEEVVEEEEEEETEEVVEEEEEEETEEVVEEEEEETEEVVEEEEEETEEVVEEEEEPEEAAEEEGVYEVSINGKAYYTTNEKNGTIYAITEDEDVGDEVGNYVNGKVVWNK